MRMIILRLAIRETRIVTAKRIQFSIRANDVRAATVNPLRMCRMASFDALEPNGPTYTYSKGISKHRDVRDLWVR